MFESTVATEPCTETAAPAEALELSVVDAVLWACDLSEDETEVGDLVEAALRRVDVRPVREPAPALEQVA